VGTDAYARLGKKLEDYKEGREKFQEWSNSTDVDEK